VALPLLELGAIGGFLADMLKGTGAIAQSFANFFTLFPLWTRPFILCGLFYADSLFDAPVIGHPIQGVMNAMLGFFGIAIESSTLAVIFFIIGCIMLLFAARTLDR